MSKISNLFVIAVVRSITKSCLTLCDSMNCSMPGFPVLHLFLVFAQIHAHWVSDANYLILYHLLLFLPSVFPSIKAFWNESVLRIRWPKYWSFSFSIVLPMNIHGWFPLGLTDMISLLSKGLLRVFTSTIWKHPFFNTHPFLWSNSHIHTWLLEKP